MSAVSDERRVVVVTGASDGIGAAAARMLARRGDTVVAVGRSPGRTRAIAGETGGEYHVADFTRLDQVRELAAALQGRHSRIDRELARRWGPLGVSAAAAHPGMVRSQWGRSGPPRRSGW